MALSDDINALPTTPADGHTGHLQNHQTIHAALKDHETRIKTSETKVPSFLALTTDNTLGRRILAGSFLIYGDTGWRNVTSLLTPAPNSGSLLVRRTAGMVHLRANSLLYNQGVTANLNMGKEWWTGDGFTDELIDRAGDKAGRIDSTADGALTIIWSGTRAAEHNASYISDAAWPTAFIGEA